MKISMDTLADGRYTLGEVLGHGGTAVVLHGHDRKLGRDVAVKLLADNLATDPATRERFLREARTAARWSHPNLVQVFDAGEENERPFMVMEYIPGPNLAQDLRARGRFAPDEVIGIGRAVCAALTHVHDAGLVHRDIKPANLLRCADGTVKMTDFGIALDPALTALTEVGTLVGTVAYLAPERADGAPASPAEDLYSLGVCLYEMLTGRVPYDAPTLPGLARQQREEDVTPIREIVPSVPPALEHAVMRCLARDPAARPPSARALAEELGSTAPMGGAPPAHTAVLQLGDEHTVLLRPPDPSPEPGPATVLLGPRPVRRRLGLLVGLALISLLLVGAVVGALLSSDPVVAPPPAAASRPATTGEPAAETPRTPAEAAQELADWIRQNTR